MKKYGLKDQFSKSPFMGEVFGGDYYAVVTVDREMRRKGARITALQKENRELLEQGIAIMDDQVAKKILLKEHVAALTAENKRLREEMQRREDYLDSIVV